MLFFWELQAAILVGAFGKGPKGGNAPVMQREWGGGVGEEMGDCAKGLRFENGILPGRHGAVTC